MFFLFLILKCYLDFPLIKIDGLRQIPCSNNTVVYYSISVMIVVPQTENCHGSIFFFYKNGGEIYGSVRIIKS